MKNSLLVLRRSFQAHINFFYQIYVILCFISALYSLLRSILEPRGLILLYKMQFY